MIDPAAATTLRAAAEVFVPGSPDGETIGAPDIEAERFLEHYLDYVLPGLAVAVTQLLDATATERFGRSFAVLSLDERTTVLDAIGEHDVEKLREIPALLGLLSVAAVYGEWTGLDGEGALVRAPVGWDMTGFPGPSRGRDHLLRGR
ncbi:MAG: gluconate 2-dehydrogenase subunit 3 family protein [Actinomycetota bacterium]